MVYSVSPTQSDLTLGFTFITPNRVKEYQPLSICTIPNCFPTLSQNSEDGRIRTVLPIRPRNHLILSAKYWNWKQRQSTRRKRGPIENAIYLKARYSSSLHRIHDYWLVLLQDITGSLYIYILQRVRGRTSLRTTCGNDSNIQTAILVTVRVMNLQYSKNNFRILTVRPRSRPFRLQVYKQTPCH